MTTRSAHNPALRTRDQFSEKCTTRSVYHFTTPEDLWQRHGYYGSGDSYHTRTIWRKPSSNLPRTIAGWVWLNPWGVRRGTWIGSGERDCSYTKQWYKGEAFHHRQLSQRRVSTKPRRKRWVNSDLRQKARLVVIFRGKRVVSLCVWVCGIVVPCVSECVISWRRCAIYMHATAFFVFDLTAEVWIQANKIKRLKSSLQIKFCLVVYKYTHLYMSW